MFTGSNITTGQPGQRIRQVIMIRFSHREPLRYWPFVGRSHRRWSGKYGVNHTTGAILPFNRSDKQLTCRGRIFSNLSQPPMIIVRRGGRPSPAGVDLALHRSSLV
jgi:hypothetical protein